MGNGLRLPGLLLATGGLFLLLAGGPARGEDRPDREEAMDYFPCMDCHADIVPNPTPRTLEEDHDDLKLDHGLDGMWCLTCHDLAERDSLTVYEGTVRIGFNDSPVLCGSCHGPQYRDWKARIHGKTTGSWETLGPRWLCVECHDPHSPRFKPLKPEAAPVKPKGWKPARIETGGDDHER